MPIFDVTFVPAVTRDALDPRWTSAPERVEAASEVEAVELAWQSWDRNTPGQAKEPHAVESIHRVD